MVLAGTPVMGAEPDSFLLGMQAMQRGHYAEAYCRWRPLAESGHTQAQYQLAWLYADGKGMPIDVQQAATWWRQAAMSGLVEAQFAVGLALTSGDGIRKDIDEALRWFETAARAGHQPARDILLRLNGDVRLGLLESRPELLQEDWFGWWARVAGDDVNVRSGQGTRHGIVTQLNADARVRVVGEAGNWYLIVLPPSTAPADTGIEPRPLTGWVYRALLDGESGAQL